MPLIAVIDVKKSGCRKHCAVVTSARWMDFFRPESWAASQGDGEARLGSTRATRLPKPGSIINMKRFLFGDDHRPT